MKAHLTPGHTRRIILLLAATLLIGHATRAQAPYLVDLSQQKLDLIDPSFYIKEVIDLRPGQTAIGFVQVGLGNTRVPAELKGGLPAALHQFMPHGNGATATARPLVMRVYELNIYEHTGAMAEKAIATVDVDFLAPQPDSSYAVALRYVDSQERAGLDITLAHDDNIAACLKRALTKLQQLNWANVSQKAPRVSRAEVGYLDGQPLASYRPPISKVAYPKRGVYRSFAQFRSNAPEPVGDLRMETNGKEKGDLFVPATDTDFRKTVRDAWGFSDGDHAYLRIGSTYRLLHPDGDNFTFRLPDANTLSAAVVGGMMLRAVGGALLGAATSSRETYVLQSRTGTVSPQALAAAIGASDTATVYVYRRPTRLVGAPPTLRVQGRALPVLAGGEYEKVSWLDPNAPMVIELTGDVVDSLSFRPTFAAANYVELLFDSKIARWQLRPVAAEAGAFQLKKCKVAEATRNHNFE